ncbi:response regulator transcription factor [uncultured Polaribacter sp.]|uniref:response regulator n=1 Tax=uncultured Polaribacter sp. TaxID=174711 RepID=UPI0026245009|nr:response regulator transcription factor [uncultured Polaribacter sp.]
MKTILKDLLIVEDHAYIRDSIIKAIVDNNDIGDLKTSSTLKEAYSLLGNTNFDLIILDLSLPDGNGVDLLKMINDKKLETKVFVFSMSTNLKRICLKHGASAFFDKANDFDKLIEAIKLFN